MAGVRCARKHQRRHELTRRFRTHRSFTEDSLTWGALADNAFVRAAVERKTAAQRARLLRDLAAVVDALQFWLEQVKELVLELQLLCDALSPRVSSHEAAPASKSCSAFELGELRAAPGCTARALDRPVR